MKLTAANYNPQNSQDLMNQIAMLFIMQPQYTSEEYLIALSGAILTICQASQEHKDMVIDEVKRMYDLLNFGTVDGKPASQGYINAITPQTP